MCGKAQEELYDVSQLRKSIPDFQCVANRPLTGHDCQQSSPTPYRSNYITSLWTLRWTNTTSIYGILLLKH